MRSSLPAAPAFGAPVPLEASPETLRFLALRRSASALNLAAPGPDADQLSDLLRIAARVPDHGKLAPWRFVILEGEAKTAFAAGLDAIAADRGEPALSTKLGKLKVPPLAVAVIYSPRPGSIPEWEQTLSAGVVCANLLYAAGAMGFGANWITDWYSYDPAAVALLGLADAERVAGFVLIGTAKDSPLERERPTLESRISRWSAPS